MKLSQDKMRALILLGIVLACAAAFQIFRMREGMENDSFTGIRFFTIENCGHCKALKPTIERLQANHGAHVKLHDGTNPDAETEQLMKQFKISSFPTMIAYKDGQPLKKPVEDRDYTSLEKLIQQLVAA
jgi:thiol-disulfide isomerase/thioredoxin